MAWRNLFGLRPSANSAPAPAAVASAATVAAADTGEDPTIARIAAIRAIGEGGDGSAIAMLSGDMQSDWRALRIAASEAIARIAEREGRGFGMLDAGEIAPEALRRRREAVRNLGEEAVGRWAGALLDSEDALVRLAAAEMLGETGSEAAARALIGALNDPDWSVVSQANEALRALGGAALPALVEARPGSDATTRASIDWCLEMLSRDPDAELREAAACALGAATR